jgi:hypothetical protein
MMNDRTKAESVLDRFYSTIYKNVYEMTASGSHSEPSINAVVISDSAVLFLAFIENGNDKDVDKVEGLPRMLKFIQKTNRAFINKRLGIPFMTTCSIAYGQFRYEDRKDLDHLRKNYMTGPSLVNAFLDSESNEPKIRPGECRILKDGLNIASFQNPILSLLDSTEEYYYFYWMLEGAHEITGFKQKYKNTWEGMYERLIELLQNPNDRTNTQSEVTF